MVSIRRRRLLGLCSGPFPRAYGNDQSPGSWNQNTRPSIVHPMPSVEVTQPDEKKDPEVGPELSTADGSNAGKEQIQQFPEVKRRKRHRRKHFENQEPCVMRGVYFKNMKWQAAIKVDKKQIHLGTVGSQEEAARLYDRAAFMCGREPNFELSEEEKQELSKFKWDEFLALTRSAINNKKHQRRISSRMKFELQNSNWDAGEGVNGIYASEDVGTSPS